MANEPRTARPNVTTTDGKPPAADAPPGAPQPINPATGQHKAYYILTEEERKKGFVRPVRRTYLHVGIAGPQFPLRDLTEDEHKSYDQYGYVQFEEYPPGHKPSSLGRYWTQKQLDAIDKGCQTSTNMGQSIAETYARDPSFYGSTFCCSCGDHFPVGVDGEFVWEDGSRVGS